MRRISIFGATGSVGQATVELVEAEGAHVVALTGGANVVRLAQDAIRLHAEIAVTAFDANLPELRDLLAGTGVEAASGTAALAEAADRPVDWCMSAIIGAAGLVPGLRALRHGTILALANKESLVCAGPLLIAEAARNGARVLPVDSEHSAVFQALAGEDMAAVEMVTLTASGGGLRDWPIDRLRHATPEEAGRHPNWSMGRRITIDSASMFNKAMELLEAQAFFGIDPDRLAAILHPQSLVHALVGFRDGATMAHMGTPDMRHAIGYALNWPERKALPVAALDLVAAGRLDFGECDLARYPALGLARSVMARGGLAGAAFNAAKETALDFFIAREIAFTDMAPLVERVLGRMDADLDADVMDLDMVQSVDAEARYIACEIGSGDIIAARTRRTAN